MLSHPDSELALRDAPLGCSLRLLLDDAAFCEALRRQMPHFEISNVRAHYVRYKPGTNCLVAYRIVIDNKERDVYAKAFTDANHAKLFRGREPAEAENSADPRRLILRDHNVAVSIFPKDQKLKSLRRLSDAERINKLLRKLLPARDDTWNCRLETLRYKPERRFVGKILSAQGRASALLKIYGNEAFDSARVGAMAFQPRERLCVPVLLAASDAYSAVAFEWAEGQALNEIITAPVAAAAVTRVGEALASLHHQEPHGLRHIPPHEQSNSLHEAASALTYLVPSQAEAAKSLALKISTCLAQSKSLPRPIHGDFYANQILLNGEFITILDMDEAAWSDPLSDLGNFMAHVEREALRVDLPRSSVDCIKDALLDGYRRKSECTVQPQLLAAHTAAALLKLTHEPFRRREQDWPRQVAKLIQRAGEIYTARKSRIGSASRRVADNFGAAEDATMPFLRRALDPVKVLIELRRALNSHARFSGNIDLQQIRVVRHKPGRRCLIEYDLTVNVPGRFERPLTVIGKVHARGVDEHCFCLMQHLRAAGFGENSVDGIAVPAPLALIPDFNMWLQLKVPGTTASALLGQPGAIEISRRIAAALIKLQRTDLALERVHTAATELGILRERLSRLARERPEWRNRLGRLLTACQQLSVSLAEAPTVPAHRDFYPDQVIIQGERLYLLDFDLSAFADPGLDAGNFIAHLREQSLRETGNMNAFIDIEQELEEKFVEVSGEHTRTRVRAYTTLSLVRHIYISTLFGERRSFTEAILELCEQMLDVSERTVPCEIRASRSFEGVRYATNDL